ncbi:MAG TPA: hypothetical protein DDY20_02325 [Desulfobulbaceae bacterium]|nr:hypothetical protein [Desulfobulbaceae bacterium]
MYTVRTAMLLFFGGVVLFAAGCGLIKNDAGEMTLAAEEQVTCIGVLPSATAPVPQGPAGEVQAASLRQGAETMDSLLQQELQGQPQVRFVGQDLIAGLSLTGGESTLALARLVGERIGCNAILETTVSRFDEREGSKYSVENPAAVAFDLTLINLENGAVLWSASFEEAQEAVSENLYELKKAKSRGFRWLSAEGLMLEGVREKLGNSPYFGKTAQAVPPRDEPSGK